MPNKTLHELIDAVLEDMRGRGYSKSRIKHCRLVLQRLEKYCDEKGIKCYSEDIGVQYISEFSIPSSPSEHNHLANTKRYISALNCIANGTEWHPARKKAEIDGEIWYADIVNDYETYLLKLDKSKKNVTSHINYVSRFLNYAEQNQCSNLGDITPEIIYSMFQEAVGKNSFRQYLNAFFKYICRKKLIDKNFSTILPKSPRNSPVPTVYQPTEVEELLSTMENQTALSKRNYAMVLIAARLGLRACDIANITFDCLHNDTIKVIQVKTKRPITLPLLPEVKEAIDDYVENERPVTDNNHIFLNKYGHGTISGSSVSGVVKKAFEKSGLDIAGRKHGSHALRSSLATALLNEGNDFPTIQRVLGQVNIQNTKSYARADIEKLRVCAIPVPESVGDFAAFLEEGVII